MTEPLSRSSCAVSGESRSLSPCVQSAEGKGVRKADSALAQEELARALVFRQKKLLDAGNKTCLQQTMKNDFHVQEATTQDSQSLCSQTLGDGLRRSADAILNKMLQQEKNELLQTIYHQISQRNHALDASRQIDLLRIQQLNNLNSTTTANWNTADALTLQYLQQRSLKIHRTPNKYKVEGFLYSPITSFDSSRIARGTLASDVASEKSMENMSLFLEGSNSIRAKALSDSASLWSTALKGGHTNSSLKKNLLSPSAGQSPDVRMLPEKPLPCPPSKRKGRPSVFPKKLYRVLSDLEKWPDGTEIASFTRDGRAFKIHKSEEFAEKVIPMYFHMTSLSSFQRQLRMYGFRQIQSGTDRGAYFHEFFISGQPSLCEQIKRN